MQTIKNKNKIYDPLTEKITNLKKRDLYELMTHLSPYLKMTRFELSREAEASPSTVHLVFNGLTANKSVISTIMGNLEESWVDDLPAKFKNLL